MYHHTQSGTGTYYATLAGLVAAIGVMIWAPPHPALWLLVAAAFLGVYTFSSMTVELDLARLTFWFGPGVFRRSFPLAELRRWTSVTNPWWYGWGIHRTRRGWLYNVGGAKAVELELTDGRRVRVGSDEPELLCQAIARAKGSA